MEEAWGSLTLAVAGVGGVVEEVGVARLALAAVAERGVAGLARSPRPAAHGGADCRQGRWAGLGRRRRLADVEAVAVEGTCRPETYARLLANCWSAAVPNNELDCIDRSIDAAILGDYSWG